MDDIELLAKAESNLKDQILLVESFSVDIGMTFRLDKCNVLHLKRGMPNDDGSVLLKGGGIIEQPVEDQSCTYLVMQVRDKLQNAHIKDKLRAKYKSLKKIWSSELNARNKVKATNTFAVPVLSYSPGVVDWTKDDIMGLDRLTRRIMSDSRAQHPRSSLNRLYMPISSGGRGLINVEALYDGILFCTFAHIYLSDDPLVKHVKIESKDFHSFLKRAKGLGLDLNIVVDYADGKVLLDVTGMGVNQVKLAIKSSSELQVKGEAV